MCAIVAPSSKASRQDLAISFGVTGTLNLLGSVKTPLTEHVTTTLSLEIVVLGEGGAGIEDIVVHDETNKVLAQLLANLKLPDFPEPIRVIYCDPSAPDFTGEVYDQRVLVREGKEKPDLNALLRTGHTWTVD